MTKKSPNNPSKRKAMYRETCPVCGLETNKPYSHYMKHVAWGDMVYEDVEEVVKTVKRVFHPVENNPVITLARKRR